MKLVSENSFWKWRKSKNFDWNCRCRNGQNAIYAAHPQHQWMDVVELFQAAYGNGQCSFSGNHRHFALRLAIERWFHFNLSYIQSHVSGSIQCRRNVRKINSKNYIFPVCHSISTLCSVTLARFSWASSVANAICLARQSFCFSFRVVNIIGHFMICSNIHYTKWATEI